MSAPFRVARHADFVQGRVVYWMCGEYRSVGDGGAMLFAPATIDAHLVVEISRSGKSFRVRDWDRLKHEWAPTRSRWFTISGWWAMRCLVLDS